MSSLERCPLFVVSFLERFCCIGFFADQMVKHARCQLTIRVVVEHLKSSTGGLSEVVCKPLQFAAILQRRSNCIQGPCITK